MKTLDALGKGLFVMTLRLIATRPVKTVPVPAPVFRWWLASDY